jgi:hypothetical protein
MIHHLRHRGTRGRAGSVALAAVLARSPDVCLSPDSSGIADIPQPPLGANNGSHSKQAMPSGATDRAFRADLRNQREGCPDDRDPSDRGERTRSRHLRVRGRASRGARHHTVYGWVPHDDRQRAKPVADARVGINGLGWDTARILKMTLATMSVIAVKPEP